MSFPAYVTDQKNNQDHYIDAFATYNADAATNTHAASNSSRRPSLQRWNTGLRIATCLLSLGATVLTLFAKSTSNGWTVDYKSSAAYGFFMGANGLMALYGLVVSAIAVFMYINGSSLSTPSRFLLTFLITDVIGVVVLLLAFAAATATESIERSGFSATAANGSGKGQYDGACSDHAAFCNVFEAGLGLSGLAILCLISSTAIDGYYLHLRGV